MSWPAGIASLAGRLLFDTVVELVGERLANADTRDGLTTDRDTIRVQLDPLADPPAGAVAEEVGDGAGNWVGKQIELYPDRVAVGGKTVPCIRVRQPIADELNDSVT